MPSSRHRTFNTVTHTPSYARNDLDPSSVHRALTRLRARALSASRQRARARLAHPRRRLRDRHVKHRAQIALIHGHRPVSSPLRSLAVLSATVARRHRPSRRARTSPRDRSPDADADAAPARRARFRRERARARRGTIEIVRARRTATRARPTRDARARATSVAASAARPPRTPDESCLVVKTPDRIAPRSRATSIAPRTRRFGFPHAVTRGRASRRDGRG